MAIRGFKMKLKHDFKETYKKRHDEIWPELKKIFADSGIIDYAIFLDNETGVVYGYQKVDELYGQTSLSENLIVKKWWDFMADIMEVNPDNSPVISALEEVFWLSSRD